MNKVRDGIALMVAMLLGVGAIYLASNWHSDPSTDATAAPSLSPGVLYSTSFPDLAGRSRSLGEWQGKIMVLNLWATWCGPCREEIPMIVKFHEKYRERGLIFIGLALDDKIPVEKFAKELKINYPILLGEADLGEFARRLGNSKGLLPYTVIIDRTGKILMTRLGGIDEKFLAQVLLPML